MSNSDQGYLKGLLGGLLGTHRTHRCFIGSIYLPDNLLYVQVRAHRDTGAILKDYQENQGY